MAFNVNEFAGALKSGGARNSLFQVNITNPINGVADATVSATIPACALALAPAALVAFFDYAFGLSMRYYWTGF